MELKNPALIGNGEFEIVKITDELYPEIIELYQNHFMKHENISIACNLAGSIETRHEMELLLKAVLSDGISFAAKHCETQKVVAFAANKILCPETDCSLSTVCADFQTPAMLCVGDVLERLECSFDIFKEWHVNCAMEIVFLSTNEKFNGRGLATSLSKHSIEFARQMLNGNRSTCDDMPAHIRNMKPQVVCSVFTSKYSQKVGERLGFQTLTKIPNADFSFEGVKFSDKLDPVHTHFTFAAMKL